MTFSSSAPASNNNDFNTSGVEIVDFGGRLDDVAELQLDDEEVLGQEESNCSTNQDQATDGSSFSCLLGLLNLNKYINVILFLTAGVLVLSVGSYGVASVSYSIASASRANQSPSGQMAKSSKASTSTSKSTSSSTSTSGSSSKSSKGSSNGSCTYRNGTVAVYGQEDLNKYPGSTTRDYNCETLLKDYDCFCYSETLILLSHFDYFKETDARFAAFEYDSTSIVSFDDVDLAAKLDCFSAFFIPAFEDVEVDGLEGNAEARAILKDFVETGGTLVVASGNERNLDLLNETFGWDLSEEKCVDTAKNVTNTAGTPWADGAGTLDCPWTSNNVACNGVACTAMWGDEAGASVAVMNQGAGKVILVAYYYGYTGTIPQGHVSGSGNDKSGEYCDDDITEDHPWIHDVLKGALLLATGLE